LHFCPVAIQAFGPVPATREKIIMLPYRATRLEYFFRGKEDAVVNHRAVSLQLNLGAK